MVVVERRRGWRTRLGRESDRERQAYTHRGLERETDKQTETQRDGDTHTERQTAETDGGAERQRAPLQKSPIKRYRELLRLDAGASTSNRCVGRLGLCVHNLVLRIIS